MVETEAGLAGPRLELPLRLRSARADGRRVRVFDFVHAEGGKLPSFDAGAHLLVEAAPRTVRSYSLCNAPEASDAYTLAVLLEKESRGGSLAMHALQVGQVVRASLPRNAFPLIESARHTVLLAGGIGITPLIAMAERLTTLNKNYELHYCCREPDSAAFLDLLNQSRFSGRIHLHFDSGSEHQRFDIRRVLAACPKGTHLYMCGPWGFMELVCNAARAADWPEERLHREDFFSAPIPHAQHASFELELSRSKLTISVGRHETALAALERSGVMVFSSCQEGICGTCVVGVLDGRPDHRDRYLTDSVRQQNDCFLPCCSRSLTPRLVVDL